MSTYTLTVEAVPRGEDVSVLSQGLTAHALPYTQGPGFQPLAVFLRDESGTLVGGVWGQVNWNWVHIGLVWVAETLRGTGYGRQLITAMEHTAKERGCTSLQLNVVHANPSRASFDRIGFGHQDDLLHYRLDAHGLRKLVEMDR